MTMTVGQALGSSTGLDTETLEMTIQAIHEFLADALPPERQLELDHEDVCPEDTVRAMCSDALGVQLLFIPEQYGGMGGNAFDVYRVCEQMARHDLGLATSVLATFLGSDPIFVGASDEQKARWLTEIAEQGFIYAYGATEPDAGSDLGALKTTATPVEEDGKVVGYRLNGRKQWISNGGISDRTTILAMAPGGPTWFVVDPTTEGFTRNKPEDKHGIRLSNTAALFLDDVYVPVEDLIGGVEGQGLVQAQQVFGYTRLMVAAFGLGGGYSALDRAIEYSTTRIQGGAPLSEKQGYVDKLIVPHLVRLEAGRAFIEHTAARIDAGEGENGALNTEGAIAKYMSTEAGNLAADAAIQAHGGYGYTREYMVEKAKRDVRITTIYEGTSEIMEMTIARDRWQQHLKTKGGFYAERGSELRALHARRPEVGALPAALAAEALGAVFEACRLARLTRNQHVLLRLGELAAFAECAGVLAFRAAAAADGTAHAKADMRFAPATQAAIARIFAREAALKVAQEGLRWVRGAADDTADLASFETSLQLPAIQAAQAGLLTDMDAVADAVYGRI
ncbi:MAG TPA: acyl-CoA dehydrogenase family protein [Mycobacteriales bacterium]|jgi:alkylation response protein AidB-like acyl-CoA dehydrogenase|nr:acyl-CoA dehydrogenase family protein [Mycobacteriales bacterium]